MENKKPYMVGICGGSASGKSWFINQLTKIFQEEITVISQDNYYKPIEQLAKDKNGFVNFDLPETIFLDQLLEDLKTLKNGKQVSKLTYHFNNPNIKREMLEIYPKKIIITEGIFIFHHPEIFQLFDLKIYLEADEEIKFLRRIKRDEEERATEKEISEYQWREHVNPAYKKYILPYKTFADKVINNNGYDDNSIHELVDMLKSKV